jgi:hypothetical protein
LVNSTKPAPTKQPIASYAEQQTQLQQALQLPVKISGNKLTISFADEDQLNAIIQRLI